MNMKRIKLGGVSAAAVVAFAATALPAVSASLPIPVHSENFGTIVSVQRDKGTMNVKLGNGSEDHVVIRHAKVRDRGRIRGLGDLYPGEKVRVFSKGMNILNRGLQAYEVDVFHGNGNYYRSRNHRY